VRVLLLSRWAMALGCAAAVLLSPALAGCSSGPSRVPASAVRPLTAIAEHFARSDGGHQPTWVSAVATTRSRAFAAAAAGHTRHGGSSAYLVTMRGRFVAFLPSKAAGAHFGVGSYLSIVVDAGTFRVVGWRLHTRPPRVRPGSVGPVTYLRK
jgi:hypothetical protein